MSRGDYYWAKDIFSDEKKLTLTVQMVSYAIGMIFALKKKNVKASKWRGSLIIWAAISFYGVSEIMILVGRQDANRYCDNLDKGLLPFEAKFYGEPTSWVFQQDNEPIQTYV